ncbi:serine/threonine-protein phosphatase [Calidifontimicrobium sp. SYSU G02091]|uniref:PP2C family protein-serine/threonine phosphatase n=1 Tax=Calidifontimicrobium sp. SYSU G02091 TaxID=2926421 RepID=UPI001F53288C|nr:PP2C family serine/threonine-protein phosphatase [Calidifontimicrobium sp. SYSU G02091]MCI1192993.1 serine/threonine-protein phosphatase [Calidifontimicrobium sp. SYSU G02091]
MRFAVYQVSRKGGREKNEDRMGYCYTRESGLFALADGMGGHPEGEVASQLALQTLAARFQHDAKPRLADPQLFLREGILAAHRELLRYAQRRALPDTPRTTVVACVLQDGALWWAHCGDSRLYVVRDGALVARTRDHSYAELHEALTLSTTVTPFGRNVLFTCLGSPSEPMVDAAGPLRLHGGDRILLCSDGLWGNVADAEIAAQLGRGTISHSVPDLVEAALREGGAKCDNVTAIAVEWEGGDDADAVSTQALGEDLFASSIQTAALGDAAADDLDDAEIERSIQEINEAIRRSAEKRH